MKWNKYAGNPVLSPCPVGSWNLIGLLQPLVLYDESTTMFKMWYCGGALSDGNISAEIGYATAPDLTVSVQNRHDASKAEVFTLHPNYPNPFNPTTMISYSLYRETECTLVIYDILGKKIKTFGNEKSGIGRYEVMWDATDDRGQPVAAGVYICRLSAGGFLKSIKLLYSK